MPITYIFRVLSRKFLSCLKVVMSHSETICNRLSQLGNFTVRNVKCVGIQIFFRQKASQFKLPLRYHKIEDLDPN